MHTMKNHAIKQNAASQLSKADLLAFLFAQAWSMFSQGPKRAPFSSKSVCSWFALLVLKGIDFTTGHIFSFFPGRKTKWKQLVRTMSSFSETSASLNDLFAFMWAAWLATETRQAGEAAVRGFLGVLSIFVLSRDPPF